MKDEKATKEKSEKDKKESKSEKEKEADAAAAAAEAEHGEDGSLTFTTPQLPYEMIQVTCTYTHSPLTHYTRASQPYTNARACTNTAHRLLLHVLLTTA